MEHGPVSSQYQYLHGSLVVLELRGVDNGSVAVLAHDLGDGVASCHAVLTEQGANGCLCSFADLGPLIHSKVEEGSQELLSPGLGPEAAIRL